MPLKTTLKSLSPARDRFKQQISLVSGGYYAKEAFPDGKVTVYPWDTTIDDWMARRIGRQMNRETLLFEAVERVADLRGVPWQDMISGDSWAILMVSRSMLSGLRINFTPKCPSCGYESAASVGVPNELGVRGTKKPDYPGYDEVILNQKEKQKEIVHTRPIFVRDEVAILQRDQEQRNRASDPTARILSAIVSINGTEPGKDFTTDDLIQWYHALDPVDVTALREHLDKTEPQLDTDIQCLCDRCTTKFTYGLRITGDFFR